MRYLLMILVVFVGFAGTGQNTQSTEQIRAQMAKIRQTTNWDDPAAAAKANEEIKKLTQQLTGQPVSAKVSSTKTTTTAKPGDFIQKIPASKESVLNIANRFFNRSFKALDAVSRQQFDLDFKQAQKDEFSSKAVKKLTSTGALLITFGNSHQLACLYLSAAVKALPDDTLAINNFGGYLRVIDSTEASLPVLLYANSLFDKSPVVLTQIGCSYFELKDYKQAEKYLKQALVYNPGFGQAHTALCDIYIQQNRLKDALIELFAGVKGMAGSSSYSQTSSRFNYLQQEAENNDTKEQFWNETGNQIKPEDAIAPLVPEDKRLKIPDFPPCDKLEDWMEGGGYATAVQSYGSFHSQLMAFSSEFLQVHQEVPTLPPNAVLRDYPDERFTLDCILEYFRKESKKEADDFDKKMDAIMGKAYKATEDYLAQKEAYTKVYVSCVQGCGTDEYCIKECERVFCTRDCPATNNYNKFMQGCYDDYREAFKRTTENQKKILDDLYGFSEPKISKIQSPYWSRIYAYEIQNVALGIIGNTYMAYPRPFPFPAHSSCGTDCSVYANPAQRPPEEVENKEPKGNNCPEGTKISLGIGFCGIDLECESIEFGCAAGVAISAKRDFKNKSSTLFVGVGGELELIGASAEAKVGATFTRYDSGDTDIGGKMEMSGTVGAGFKTGGNVEMSASIMEGAKTEYKNVIGVGL